MPKGAIFVSSCRDTKDIFFRKKRGQEDLRVRGGG
jgi:hypothetical protein